KAAGPAVGHDQGHGVGADAPFVDEMNVQTIHRGLVMVPAVELCLLGAPIEARAPVLDQFFEVIQVPAIIPPRARHLIEKTGMAQTPAQVFQDVVRDVDRERPNLHGGSSNTPMACLSASGLARHQGLITLATAPNLRLASATRP